MTSTSLWRVIAQDRGWLQRVLKDDIPGGNDLLSIERGDTMITEQARRKERQQEIEEENKVKRERRAEEREKRRLEEAAAAAAAREQKEAARRTVIAIPVPPVPSTSRSPAMSLIEVQKKTKKIILTETDHSVSLGRTELIGLLKSCGVPELPRQAKILLPLSNGDTRELQDGEALTIQWTESKTTEEESD